MKTNIELSKETRSLFLLVFLLVPVSQLSIDQCLPSLPAMQVEFHSTSTMMQLTISLYLLGLGISQLIYGSASDWHGRKLILMFGLSIYVAASIVASLAQSVMIFSVSRLFQGFGIGVGSVLPKAIASDIYSKEKLTKILSNITIVWTLTTILAPLLGGYIQEHLGWRANFYILSFYSFALLILYWKFFQETNTTTKGRTNFKSLIAIYQSIIQNKLFLGYMLCLMLSFSILIAFSISATFLLQIGLNITPINYGKVMMLIGFTYIIGNAFSNFFTKKYQIRSVIFLGTFIILVSALIFLVIALIFSISLLAFLLPVMLIVFGIGLIYSNCMSLALNTYPDFSGSVSAVIGSFLMLGSSVTNTVIAHLQTINPLPLALIVNAISFIIFVVYFYLNKNLKRRNILYV